MDVFWAMYIGRALFILSSRSTKFINFALIFPGSREDQNDSEGCVFTRKFDHILINPNSTRGPKWSFRSPIHILWQTPLNEVDIQLVECGYSDALPPPLPPQCFKSFLGESLLSETRKDDRGRSLCCNVANNMANPAPNYSLLTSRCSSVPILSENFACGIRNPGLWNLENSSRNPESH